MSSVTPLPEAKPSACALYIQQASAAALRVGETDGRVQAYQTFLPDAPPDAVGQLRRDLDAARKERDAARAAGSSLGAPPTVCGPLSLTAITQPGMAVGQKVGARAAFFHYGALLGGKRETQVRFIAETTYPEVAVMTERASYDSLVRQMQDHFGKQTLASR